MRQAPFRKFVRGAVCATLILGTAAACQSDDDEGSVATADGVSPETADLEAELAAAEARADAAEAALAEAASAATTLETEVATLTAERDTALADVATAQASLTEAEARATAAEETLSAIGDEFPVTIDSLITDFDPTGRYAVTFTESFCDGLENCGTERPPAEAQIVQGSNGLELNVTGAFSAGLLRSSGQLMAVTDSDTMVTCNGAPRVTRVSVTVFGLSVIIDETGTQQLDQIGASVEVRADPFNGCDFGAVLYGAILTPIPE